jgi:hypothetical protein
MKAELQPDEPLKTRTVGQLRKHPPDRRLVPARRSRQRREREYGFSFALSQARKNIQRSRNSRQAHIASLKRLVNSARFDKAGGGPANNISSKYHEALFEPGRHVATSSGGLALQSNDPIPTFAAVAAGNPGIKGSRAKRALKPPEIVRRTIFLTLPNCGDSEVRKHRAAK